MVTINIFFKNLINILSLLKVKFSNIWLRLTRVEVAFPNSNKSVISNQFFNRTLFDFRVMSSTKIIQNKGQKWLLNFIITLERVQLTCQSTPQDGKSMPWSMFTWEIQSKLTQHHQSNHPSHITNCTSRILHCDLFESKVFKHLYITENQLNLSSSGNKLRDMPKPILENCGSARSAYFEIH